MVGSITTLQIDDESIDWVLCTEVLEHINCDSAAARELGRVLRKGGFALVSVPRPPAPFDPAHVREGYSLEDLSKLLAVGGLELVGHWYCMHLFMRALARVWRYQYEHLGRKRRSLMPRLAVLVFAYVDRWFRIGSPWDIVVLARRV
jgi:ubiquinone/menaquinone biosynthesis C-methylase UbiE